MYKIKRNLKVEKQSVKKIKSYLVKTKRFLKLKTKN